MTVSIKLLCYQKITEGHLTEEQALDEIRDLCVQLQKMRDRMPSRGPAVTMVSTLLEQCKVSSKPPQMITVDDVKKADSHSNGSKEISHSKKAPHSTDDIQHMKTCSKNDIDVNGARNVCEQMRSHLNQVNRNATCPTHICTTADVCDARGVGKETAVHSGDCHNERQLSQQSKNQQSLQNVTMENASRNERQPSSPPSSPSSKGTEQKLDFSNLKLRCMCSEADKFHSRVMTDATAVAEINDSENATAFNASCLQFHRCDTPDCVKECYFVQRCCFCRRQSNYNSDATSAGQATASANNKSSNVQNHGEAAVRDSVHISQHSHSCSGGSNLNLTLSTRKSDKICRCETEHCHNNQSYCDDGAIKNTCHCMRMCDFDVDRIDNEREKLSVHTVIFTPDATGSAALANASTPDRIRIKCDKSLVATAGHPFTDREAGTSGDLNAETASTTTDAGNSASHSATVAVADDTSNVINNSTNEKRNKTTEKLVLDLNDRSKYTKEVSV